MLTDSPLATLHRAGAVLIGDDGVDHSNAWLRLVEDHSLDLIAAAIAASRSDRPTPRDIRSALASMAATSTAAPTAPHHQETATMPQPSHITDDEIRAVAEHIIDSGHGGIRLGDLLRETGYQRSRLSAILARIDGCTVTGPANRRMVTIADTLVAIADPDMPADQPDPQPAPEQADPDQTTAIIDHADPYPGIDELGAFDRREELRALCRAAQVVRRRSPDLAERLVVVIGAAIADYLVETSGTVHASHLTHRLIDVIAA